MNSETKIIDIYPVSKGKRVLTFLADFFICLIFSMLCYNLLIYPSLYLLNGMESKQQQAYTAENNVTKVLVENNLLIQENSGDDFSTCLSSTYSYFIKEYVEEKIVKEADVFSIYYVDIKQNSGGFALIFEDFGTNYFDFSDGKASLKSPYVSLLNPILDSKDGLNEEGEEAYEEIQNKFFLTAYSRLLNDAKENDLTSGHLSYKSLTTLIDDFNALVKEVVLLSCFISYGVAILIYYLLIPVANKNKKSLGTLMLRYETINIDKMGLTNNKTVLLNLLYRLFTNLTCLVFIPLLSIKIEYIFNLPILWWLSGVALLIQIVNLIYLLVNKSGQSLIDKLTNTAVITSDSLDNIYRNKGYKI